MIIKGANTEIDSVELKRLSEYNWFKDPKYMEIVKSIENLYLNAREEAKLQNISSMGIDENNQVVIDEHALNHRCSNSIEALETISKYGVLATEWFGELESEREACFCAFLSRMKGEDYPSRGDLAEDDKTRLNIGNNILLFFDENNPVMNYLLHLDYFEFEYKKRTDPEYSSKYSEDELKILEGLIEPLSPAGKDMRKSYNFKTNYWSAIPGGIPSELVNGICIKNNIYSEEEVDKINNLFPNAVLFDSNKNVVRHPFVESNIKNETKSSKLK